MPDLKTDNGAVNEVKMAHFQVRTKQHNDDMAWLIGYPQGRRILAHLLDKFGLLHDCFNTNGMVMAQNAALQKSAQILYEEILASSGWRGFSQVMEEDLLRQEKERKEVEILIEKQKGVDKTKKEK